LAGLLYKKTKVFLRTMCAFSILVYSLTRFDLADRGVRQPVQPRTFYARLFVFYKTYVQPAASFCSCKLLWRSDECVLHPCFNAQPDIF